VRDIVWKSEMPKKGRTCLFKCYYMSILMHEAETWTPTKTVMRRLSSRDDNLRYIEGKSKRDRIRNKQIRENPKFKHLGR
jgi:hypothetical protein